MGKLPFLVPCLSLSLLFLRVPTCCSGKESACQCRQCGFDPWVGKVPWRRKWQPTLVFLPGESHGQESLVGHSSQGCKESDKTEHSHTGSSEKRSQPDRSCKCRVPISHYCLLVGDIFWFWGLSLSTVCLLCHVGRVTAVPSWSGGEGGKRGRVAVLLGEAWWIFLEEERNRCLEVNRPSLSQLDRAKRGFLARFSNFDLKKAALPNK